ncbi:MAG: peptidylprolyl isomerase [Parvibaculum sp.]
MNEALKPFFTDVTVNGELIPRAAIAAETQNHPGEVAQPASVWTKAAQALAIRALLLQEAARRGIEAAPLADGQARKESDDEALVRELLDEVVESVSPSAEDVKTEWARDPSRFQSPPLWEASHILIAYEGDAMREMAFERARSLTVELQTHPDRFAKLAMANSQCGSRADGGFLGQLRQGDTIPPFEAAMRALKPGETSSAPVETEHGFHVIRLDAYEEGRVLPYEIVQVKISEAMEKVAWTESARQFVDGLIAKAEITGTSFTNPDIKAAG